DEAVNSGADQTPGTADDVRWTLSDHQNSVRDILVRDDNGTPGYPDDDEWRVGNHVTYDAWGNTLAETDAAISCLFGWTGRLRDKLTGLQNNGNRWYDAVLAHWQSEDPISFAAGDANLYRYCGNDPLNWIDPSGLERYPWQSMGGWNPFSWPIVRMVPNLLTGNSDIYGRRDGEIARKNEDARIRLLSYDVDFSRNYDRFQRSQFKEAARLSAEKATDGVTVIAASASMASASVPRTPLGPSQYGPSQTGRVLPTKPPLVGQGVPKNPASVPLGPKVKPGTYVYVQDGSGVVHVVPNGQHLHPTVLGGGQPGAAAGELVVGRGGVVTEINNISYTFQFGQEVLPGVRDAVLRQGFRVAPDAIKPFTH
ncbi:MAG: RHS repeat-associated core domain-containing protein, partial [Pirellulaceae bacterium]|nr:RHS repeat-associated core domain-containing protein [Pirellulaceae bacterium]